MTVAQIIKSFTLWEFVKAQRHVHAHTQAESDTD